MSCDAGHCITCSDEGVEMRVVQVDEARAMALCEDGGGVRSSVEIALVEAAPGDTLLVHAGTALLKVGPDAEPLSPDAGPDALRSCAT